MKKALLTLLVLLLPSSALAGFAEKAYRASLDSAYYVGVVEVLDTVLVDPQNKDKSLVGVEMTVRIFSDYRKQESAAPRDIKISQTLASCNLYPRKKGAIYEAIIMQQGESFIFASQPMQFTAEDIEKFRASTPFPEVVLKNKEKCESGGNVWSFPLNGQPECKIPAKDADKECTVSEECEGLCLAQFSKEGVGTKFEKLLIDPNGTDIDALEYKTGKCSEWMNMTGCQYIFEGRTVRHVCREF
jgi:hypothetical protein